MKNIQLCTKTFQRALLLTAVDIALDDALTTSTSYTLNLFVLSTHLCVLYLYIATQLVSFYYLILLDSLV